MKNHLMIFVLLCVVCVVTGMVACSSTSDPAPDPNEAPTAAVNPVPANMAAAQPIDVALHWDPSTDPDNDSVTYDVYMKLFVGGDFELVAEDLKTPTYQPDTFPGMRFEATYEWKVVTKDARGATISSAEWMFTVEECPKTPGTICTWAGIGGVAGLGAEGQKPGATELHLPQDVVFAPDGTPWIVDWNNHRVLRLESDGTLKTMIGGQFGNPTSGELARDLTLNHPTHIAFLPATNEVLLSAWHNSLLMRVDLSTNIATTFCGDGTRSFRGDGGMAGVAWVDLPVNLIHDGQGHLYVGDQGNMCIRRINPDSTIETIAGTPDTPGFSGDGGIGRLAKFRFEDSQAAQPSGKMCFNPAGDILVADTDNHCVRILKLSEDMDNPIIDTFAGNGTMGGFAGDGGPAASARLRDPRDVACDPTTGDIYIADAGNHCIRVVIASTGMIHTVAGTPLIFGRDARDGLPALQAKLNSPYGVEIGPNGHLWITNTANHTVRIVWDPLTNVP